MVNSLPQEAVAEYVRRNADAYVAIWEPLITRLYNRHGQASRIVDEEDMQQEALLKVLTCIGRYDPQRQPAKGRSNYQRLNNFVVTCIRRELISHGWRNSFAPHVPSGSMRVVDSSTQERCKPSSLGLEDIEAETEDIEQRAEVHDLIDRYDEDGILGMYYLRGLTQREIADELRRRGHGQVSTSTVSRRMNRIQDKIREEITW